MIEKCGSSKYINGRHSWRPGGWRKTTCRFCGRKWVDVQIDPPPSAPLKVLIAEILETLKSKSEPIKTMECECCFCKWQAKQNKR